MNTDTFHPLRPERVVAILKRRRIRSHIRLMGCHAGWSGKAITTCPKLTPQLRKVWLSGWRCGRKEYNVMDRYWTSILRGRRR